MKLKSSNSNNCRYAIGERDRTPVRGNPKADPKMAPSRHSQPIASLVVRGNLNQGVCTQGTHTASTGLVTTELGINRNAITLEENQEEKKGSMSFPQIPLGRVT